MNLKVSEEELKSALLHKLTRKRKWGRSHTSFENLAKGFPSHYRKEAKKIGKSPFLFGAEAHAIYGWEEAPKAM